LRRIFETICKWKHWEIIELNIQEDHIHFCLLATPRDSVSYVMQILKGKSSAWLKKKIKRTHGLYEKNPCGHEDTSSRPSDSMNTSYAATSNISTITIRPTNHLCSTS
jgi:REP element-mobilizing transposase RayT